MQLYQFEVLKGEDAISVEASVPTMDFGSIDRFGHNEQELSETLKAIASEIGLRHIVHLRFASKDGGKASLPTAVATYSRAWQTRYFVKGYECIDPVLAIGRNALLPFDWEALCSDEPATSAFLADAAEHGVGRNGLSIPVRNRVGARSLASFTSDHAKAEWGQYKRANMTALQKLSVLIDSAVDVLAKLSLPVVVLSRCESECLIWAARGKAAEEIGEVLKLSSGLVKAHLDTARHKLHCVDLRHAIAVAVATGAIPAAPM